MEWQTGSWGTFVVVITVFLLNTSIQNIIEQKLRTYHQIIGKIKTKWIRQSHKISQLLTLLFKNPKQKINE